MRDVPRGELGEEGLEDPFVLASGEATIASRGVLSSGSSRLRARASRISGASVWKAGAINGRADVVVDDSERLAARRCCTPVELVDVAVMGTLETSAPDAVDWPPQTSGPAHAAPEDVADASGELREARYEPIDN